MRAWPLILLLAAGCAGARLRAAERIGAHRAQLTAGKYAELIVQLDESSIAELHRSAQGEAYRLLGDAYARSGDQPRALQTYQYGVGLFPKNLPLLTSLADLLRAAGLPDRAKPYYERVLDIHPNNAPSNLGMAHIYRVHGYLAKSEEHFRRALAEWRDNPHIWRSFAEVLADQRDFDGATEAIARALELKTDAESLTALARFERRQEMHPEAYEHLKQALAAAPAANRSEILLRRGLWQLADGRVDDCAQTAAEVLAAAPHDPLGRWLRASVALRRGKRREAREDLAAAARAERTHPFVAKTARVMLDELARAP